MTKPFKAPFVRGLHHVQLEPVWGKLEDAATLKQRIEEASRYVPLENLALSPQCGFASMMEGNLLTEEQQWAKLRLVSDTARQVWK